MSNGSQSKAHRSGAHRTMEEKHAALNIVYCTKCGMGNPTANKFCFGCGNSLLSMTCSYCSQVNPHYAKFCGSCGRKLKPIE